MIEVLLGVASGLGLAYAISNGRWHRFLAVLLLAVLFVGYLVHMKVVRSTAEFAIFDQAYIRLSLAFTIGFMCYWIGYLAIDPVARTTPMSQGVQSVIRSLILAATIFGVLLAMYVGPPVLVRQLTQSLHQADIMGLKFSFRAMSGSGSGSASRADGKTDHSNEPFARPFPELGLAVDFLDTIRSRDDQQYYDAFRVGRSWSDSAKSHQEAFAKVYYPAAACLHFLKLRSLSNEELDDTIADANQLFRELLQLSLFVPSKSDQNRVELRPNLGEELRSKLLDTSNKVFDALSDRWNEVRARYADTLYRSSDVGSVDGSEATYWQRCDDHAKLGNVTRQHYIERALSSLDLRHDHVAVLSSFFSLYIGDRPHALQRFDRWIEAAFKPEIDAARPHHLVGSFAERAKSFCERTPGPGDDGEKALLLCLSYARISANQKAVIDLYDDVTPAKISAQYVLAKQAFEIYTSLYSGMERTFVESERKNCKKSWLAVCSEAQFKILAAVAITGNGMVYALSQLGAAIPAADAELADRYCDELWSRGMDGTLSAISSLQDLSLWDVKGALVDSCGRWELRRAHESARDDAAAIKILVERLQAAIADVRQATIFWQSATDRPKSGDEVGIFARMQHDRLEPVTLSYSFRQLQEALSEARDVLQARASEL